jgi:oxalate decarboxylase/phosphoglucose isomerase-like protein (cupin superfamily)
MADQTNKFSLYSTDPREFSGGSLQTVTRSNFAALAGLSLQSLRMAPGGIREFHIHPNAAQMDFTIAGRGRIGLVGPEGERQLLEMLPGDVSFIPQGFGHWIENPGDEELQMILIVNHAEPQTIFLSDMIRSLPQDTVERSYGGPDQLLAFFGGR